MSKYKAIKTEVDGITFDSKREAFYYCYFKKLEQAKEIFNLQLQVPYTFVLDGKKIFKYVADFQYIDKDGKGHVIDVKGVETPVFRLKKKLIEAQYKITIEIRK